MPKKFLYGYFLLISLGLYAQKSTSDAAFSKLLNSLLQHSAKEVLPHEISNEEEIIFLDTREKIEYDTSHIKNAKWVGYNDFQLERVKEIPKNKPIVVYCTVGYRSEKIAEILKESGYTEVKNLYGGIFEWVHQQHNVYNDTTLTHKIHTYNKDWAKWLKTGEKIY